MNEKYQVGDFGEATFIAKTGWKAPTICYGHVTAIEARIVEFTDNEGNVYLIQKSKFSFEKRDFISKLA